MLKPTISPHFSLFSCCLVFLSSPCILYQKVNYLHACFQAWHPTTGTTGDEITYFKYFSPYDKYLSITTSTPEPKVNEYMIFTIRTNVLVDEVHYVVSTALWSQLKSWLSVIRNLYWIPGPGLEENPKIWHIFVYHWVGSSVISPQKTTYGTQSGLWNVLVCCWHKDTFA